MTVGRSRPRGVLWAGAVAAMVLLTACGQGAAAPDVRPFGGPGSALPRPAGAATPAPQQAGAFPAVLSETMSDSGRTVTSDQLVGEQIAGSDRPAGFRGMYVVVSAGLGSFSLAAPRSYSVVWRAGTSPAELLTEGERRDPAWAEQTRRTVEGADPAGPLRAVVLDTARTDEAAALILTLGPAGPATGDALAEEMRAEFTRQGHAVQAAGPVRVNGADGAYVEFVSASRAGGEPRVRLQVRIPDPPNGMVWGLTCDAPESRRAEVRDHCAQIAGTFRPLPRVSG